MNVDIYKYGFFLLSLLLLLILGNRPNEIQHFIPNGGSNATHNPLPPLKRELPQDLSEKELLKEAAKVIAQAERIKCTVDTPKSIAGVRIKDKEVEGIVSILLNSILSKIHSKL